jgi:CRP-like cAMP-binding protein
MALLERAPLFVAFTPDELRAIGGRLRARHFAQGEIIIRQGEVGDYFYVIRRGRVAVVQRDAQELEQVVNELVTGDYFGEAALLTREPRNATIRALTPVEVLTLNRRDFDRLVRAGFKGHDKMDAMLRRVRLLRRIPLFADFESFELRLLAAWLESVTGSAGQVVCAQGEPGDKFTSSRPARWPWRGCRAARWSSSSGWGRANTSASRAADERASDATVTATQPAVDRPRRELFNETARVPACKALLSALSPPPAATAKASRSLAESSKVRLIACANSRQHWR